MGILQFIKKYFFDINVLIGMVIGMVLLHTFSRSREGFQTTNPTNTDTPAACAMMKLILENSQKNLNKAKENNDEAALKNLQLSFNNIQDEMKKMSCI